MPELNELLSEEAVPHYPYEKTFEQARLDPYLTLHTSGSTGLPKPIVTNHAFIAAMETTLNLIPDTIANQPVLKDHLSMEDPFECSPLLPLFM